MIQQTVESRTVPACECKKCGAPSPLLCVCVESSLRRRWAAMREWLEAQEEDSTVQWAGVSARTAFRDAVDRMDYLDKEYP